MSIQKPSHKQLPSKQVRPLGFFESVLTEVFEIFPGASQMVGIASIHGLMSPEIFQNTWKLLYQKHPFLRCRVNRDNDRLSFVEDVVFEDIVIEILDSPTGEEPRASFNRHLNEPIKQHRSLWHSTMFRPSPLGDPQRWWLLLKISHSITDGLSAAMLIDDFLSVAARMERDIPINQDSFAIPEPIEQSIQPAITLEDFMASSEELAKPIPTPTHWPMDKYVPCESRSVHTRFEQLTPDRVARLRDLAHEKGTTLQGVIAAANQIATARFLGKTINLDLSTPVDLRNRCKIPRSRHEMSLSVSLVPTAQPGVAPDADPWMLACDYHEILEQNIPRLQTWPMEFTSEEIRDIANSWSATSAVFEHGATITNLGYLSFEKEHGRFTIEHLNFMANVCGGACPLVILVLTLPNGELHFTFGWMAPLMSDHSANILIDAMLGILEDMDSNT